VVIYCSSKSIDQIKLALKTKLNINTADYFAKLSSEKRMAAIFDFNYTKYSVLITTELANRGFNFIPPIDAIISFDACENAED
jgi:superfamily II DNA/RNA helicase